MFSGKSIMIRKIVRVIKNPKKYFSIAIKVLQQKLCFIFTRTAFFMQGQMDINPKSLWHNPEFIKQTGGYFPKEDNRASRFICDLEPWDTTRKDMLILLLRTIVEKKTDGDFAELGVYKGLTAKLIHYYAPERNLHLFDTYKGFGSRSVIKEESLAGYTILGSYFSDTTLDQVKKNILPVSENIWFYEGYFPDTIPDGLRDHNFAFVHLDADLYEPTFEGLMFFYPRMSKDGLIVIHDYNAWPGARKAVDDFFADKNEIPIPMPDKSGSALIVKH